MNMNEVFEKVTSEIRKAIEAGKNVYASFDTPHGYLGGMVKEFELDEADHVLHFYFDEQRNSFFSYIFPQLACQSSYSVAMEEDGIVHTIEVGSDIFNLTLFG